MKASKIILHLAGLCCTSAIITSRNGLEHREALKRGLTVAAGKDAQVDIGEISVIRTNLEDFAVECNPTIKFFDPLGLSTQNFWGTSNDATISFLQHAEMKHGRIAMLSFVGYCVQASHIHFPWATPENGFPPSELSPPEQWEVFDPIGKLQIFTFIFLMEVWSEYTGDHYMTTGGKPGSFPSFRSKTGEKIWLDFWDPLEMTSKMSPVVRRQKLAKEVNNGRLAMLGLFGFFVESKIPGALPVLDYLGVVQHYDGQYLLPFNYWDVITYNVDRTQFMSGTGAAIPTITPW